MRLVCGLFFLLLLAFAIFQYNDPDPFLWIGFYGVAAAWSGFAALRPKVLVHAVVSWLLAITVIAAFVLMLVYWPQPFWWRHKVWWETETAREGMGMMIVFVAMVLVAMLAVRTARNP